MLPASSSSKQPAFPTGAVVRRRKGTRGALSGRKALAAPLATGGPAQRAERPREEPSHHRPDFLLVDELRPTEAVASLRGHRSGEDAAAGKGERGYGRQLRSES